ncbi:MAG: MoaD/ThiS family protein [Candidatus Helarchaeota archaeon]
MSITVKVKFFALQREETGVSEIDIELDGKKTVLDLRQILMEKYPGLKKYEQVTLVSLNQKYARGHEVLKDGDEVALFPFVGGG